MLDFITHQVLVYQKAGEEERKGERFRELLQELTCHIYLFPGKRRALKEEDWSGFLLSFQGRLPGIILGYTYQGPPFVAYLNRFLTWQLKNWYGMNQKERYQEYAWLRESVLEYETEEAPSCLCISMKMAHILDHSGMGSKRKASLRQRLLILLLKNIHFYHEDEYLACFPLLGPGPEEALEFRKKLYECMNKKLNRMNHLSEKRNVNYSKFNLYEEWGMDAADPIKQELYSWRSTLYRKRIQVLDKQLDAVSLVPYNSDIADILNIPKGTVDSGLFYIRAYLMSLCETEVPE